MPVMQKASPLDFKRVSHRGKNDGKGSREEQRRDVHKLAHP